MKKNPTETEVEYLKGIRVRVIEETGPDRERFDELLRTKHYLHSDRIGGRHLRYVAEDKDGEWVAIASFSGATPKLKAREKWIGWNKEQKDGRLDRVINNSRFLVLKERNKVPNLASKVISLCLKRLENDWKQRWNTTPLIVESFVDESQYRGTCYRATGFEAVGMTAGFGRNQRDYYIKHESPKQLYLRELRSGARELLRAKELPEAFVKEDLTIARSDPLSSKSLTNLFESFREIGHCGRYGHGLRHPTHVVLACAVVAMIMGADNYQAFEDVCKYKLTNKQRQLLGCYQNKTTGKYEAPSDSAFFRALKRVDPDEFERVVAEWLVDQAPKHLQKYYAVDGKVLRNSGTSSKQPTALLSVVSHQLNLTIKSVPIAEKSNEIPAIKPLLKGLDLEGCCLTADALHCQQETARHITQDLGADYVFGLKGNQGTVHQLAEHKLDSVFFSLS
jgi:hypothetical protein